MRDIDRLVLARVATLLGSRPNGPRVAINLSALSVTDPAMLAHVERCLSREGADPSRLVIEITETAAISDMGRARAFCQGLAALGCEVALDDFGAGYGSFHYLTQLPFDYLKIDGSFVRGLTGSRNDQLVVQALVGSPAAWACARSPSTSPIDRRSRCCAATASTTRKVSSWAAPPRFPLAA